MRDAWIESTDVKLAGVLYLHRRAGWRYNKAYHTHLWEFWATTHGQTWFEVGRRVLEVPVEHALLLRPGVRHRQSVPGRTSCLGLTVHFFIDRRLPIRLSGKVLNISRWCRMLLGQFVESSEAGPIGDARRRTLWAMMLNELIQPTPEESAWKPTIPVLVPHDREFTLARRVIDHLRGNLSRSGNLMEELCALTGYRPAHLRTLFRRQSGVSIIEALQRLRIEEALRLLRHSTLKVSAIAERLGFTRTHKFNAFFKARMRCTPTQFIRGASRVGWTLPTTERDPRTDEVYID